VRDVSARWRQQVSAVKSRFAANERRKRRRKRKTRRELTRRVREGIPVGAILILRVAKGKACRRGEGR